MWQPDLKVERPSYPKGGVAPSSYDLALFNYLQKARTRQNARTRSTSLSMAMQKVRPWRRRWRAR